MTDFQLSPIEKEGKRVLTTAQLAEAYETDSKVISKNFGRNKDRYTEGKHFYCLTGAELKEFKTIRQFDDSSARINVLYLWTEKGALLHAKSLNTDKAWEVYDYLVESYFTKKTADYSGLSPQLQYLISLEQKTKALEQKQTELENKLAESEKNRDEIIKATFEFGRIGELQRNEITKAVKKRAIELCRYAETYDKVGKSVISSIYKGLQKEFKVKSYLDLSYNQYTDCMIFIQYFFPDQKLDLKIMHEQPKPSMKFFEMLNESVD